MICHDSPNLYKKELSYGSIVAGTAGPAPQTRAGGKTAGTPPGGTGRPLAPGAGADFPRPQNRTHRRPGRPAVGAGHGQRGGGLQRQVHRADHPGEHPHLLQPGLCGAGGPAGAGRGLQGHDVPGHRHRQLPHRHRPAAPLPGHPGEAVPHQRGPGEGGAGRAAGHRPRPQAGAGGHCGAGGGGPDPRRRPGAVRAGDGERGPDHRRGRPHHQGRGGRAAVRQLCGVRQVPGPAGAGGLRLPPVPGGQGRPGGGPLRDDEVAGPADPVHRLRPHPHRRGPVL